MVQKTGETRPWMYCMYCIFWQIRKSGFPFFFRGGQEGGWDDWDWPAAADVADWTAWTPALPFTAGLALGLRQAGTLRPALALRLRPAAGQGVALLHHNGPPSSPSPPVNIVQLHFDTRKSVSITITHFSPMISILVPVLGPLWPLTVLVVIVVTVVMMVITVLVVTEVVGVVGVAPRCPTLRLYAGPVQGLVPAAHHGARGRGQRPRPGGPGGQGVRRPVTPGHLNTSQSTEISSVTQEPNYISHRHTWNIYCR